MTNHNSTAEPFPYSSAPGVALVHGELLIWGTRYETITDSGTGEHAGFRYSVSKGWRRIAPISEPPQVLRFHWLGAGDGVLYGAAPEGSWREDIDAPFDYGEVPLLLVYSVAEDRWSSHAVPKALLLTNAADAIFGVAIGQTILLERVNLDPEDTVIVWDAFEL